jgi:hypothetical protein
MRFARRFGADGEALGQVVETNVRAERRTRYYVGRIEVARKAFAQVTAWDVVPSALLEPVLKDSSSSPKKTSGGGTSQFLLPINASAACCSRAASAPPLAVAR